MAVSNPVKEKQKKQTEQHTEYICFNIFTDEITVLSILKLQRSLTAGTAF